MRSASNNDATATIERASWSAESAADLLLTLLETGMRDESLATASSRSNDDPWIAALGQLCAKLRRLDELERDFDRLLQTAKLDAIKELAYGAGHEINNPLANISTRAQTLLRDEKNPERRRMLATINRQAFRAHEMIADLMLFARPPEPCPKQVDLSQLADRVIADLSDEASQRAIIFIRQPANSPVTVQADPTQLAVALRAICVNAIEAIGSGGTIEVSVDRAPTGAQIVVSDDGPGMDERQLAHLFDPFFSGREAGRGLGLGLSKCCQIVKAHGGEILVESQPRRGATFTLTLPTNKTAEDAEDTEGGSDER